MFKTSLQLEAILPCGLFSLMVLSLSLQAMNDNPPLTAPSLALPLVTTLRAHSATVAVASAVALTGLLSFRRWHSDRQQYQMLLQDLTPLADQLQTQSQQAHTAVIQLADSLTGVTPAAVSITSQSRSLAQATQALDGSARSLQNQLAEQSQMIRALLQQVQATRSAAQRLRCDLAADHETYRQQFAGLATAQTTGLAATTQRLDVLQITASSVYTGLVATTALAQANDRQQVALAAQLASMQRHLVRIKSRLATRRANVVSSDHKSALNLAQSPLIQAALNYR